MLDLLDLSAVESAHLRTEEGRTIPLDVQRWLRPVDAVDQGLLLRVRPPALDVGCGPGRHVEALTRRGMAAVGLDISPTAVSLARQRGAPVLLRSIFEPLLDPGRWRTALLLDGSVGIGGDPVALLRQVGRALGIDGRVLVETEPPEAPTETLLVSAGVDGGTWFPWALVSARDVAVIARRSGFGASEVWEHDGRWFAELRRAR